MDMDTPTQWLMREHGANARAPFKSRVASAGRQLPAARLTTDALMRSTRHRTHIDLERLTGIHERRVSLGEETSLTLAVGAANDCLARSSWDAADLDVVISCSITKYREGLNSGSNQP